MKSANIPVYKFCGVNKILRCLSKNSLYTKMLLKGCLGYFGSDSSKSTKFGPEVSHVILFGSLTGAKTGASCGRNIDKIQNGRRPVEMSIAI